MGKILISLIAFTFSAHAELPELKNVLKCYDALSGVTGNQKVYAARSALSVLTGKEGKTLPTITLYDKNKPQGFYVYSDEGVYFLGHSAKVGDNTNYGLTLGKYAFHVKVDKDGRVICPRIDPIFTCSDGGNRDHIPGTIRNLTSQEKGWEESKSQNFIKVLTTDLEAEFQRVHEFMAKDKACTDIRTIDTVSSIINTCKESRLAGAENMKLLDASCPTVQRRSSVVRTGH